MPTKQNTKTSDTASTTGAKQKTSTMPQPSTAQASSTEVVEDAAKTIYEQAKDTAGQAFGAATDKASSKVDEQKTNLSGGLSDVAGSLRKVGDTLRDSDKQSPVIDAAVKYSDLLAHRIEQISNYVEQKDLPEILRDTEKFAKRNPAIFVGGALVLGFAAARFLKTSNPHQQLMLRSQNSGSVQSGKTNDAGNPAKTNTDINASATDDRQDARQQNAAQI